MVLMLLSRRMHYTPDCMHDSARSLVVVGLRLWVGSNPNLCLCLEVALTGLWCARVQRRLPVWALWASFFNYLLLIILTGSILLLRMVVGTTCGGRDLWRASGCRQGCRALGCKGGLGCAGVGLVISVGSQQVLGCRWVSLWAPLLQAIGEGAHRRERGQVVNWVGPWWSGMRAARSPVLTVSVPCHSCHSCVLQLRTDDQQDLGFCKGSSCFIMVTYGGTVLPQSPVWPSKFSRLSTHGRCSGCCAVALPCCRAAYGHVVDGTCELGC